jgi:primase-polymerase (primpol)-like protein
LDTASGRVFVKGMRQDHAEAWTQQREVAVNPHVENPTTDRFLDALGAWLQASPAWYRNTGRSYSDEPTWSSFAHALSAALIYE